MPVENWLGTILLVQFSTSFYPMTQKRISAKTFSNDNLPLRLGFFINNNISYSHFLEYSSRRS